MTHFDRRRVDCVILESSPCLNLCLGKSYLTRLSNGFINVSEVKFVISIVISLNIQSWLQISYDDLLPFSDQV